MITEREKILGRIREALRVPAPRPGHRTAGDPVRVAAQEAQRWLPPVGADPEAWAALFAQNATELKAGFFPCPDEAAARATLGELAKIERWERLASHRGMLTDDLVPALGARTLWTDESHAVADLAACDVGITECDVLIAQTGSVLITALSAGGRALSVLPPHHVVLARRAQLVPDLPSAYAHLHQHYGPQMARPWPSFISLITGPSRTGDIERILVLGAHGPKKLSILCW
jgi:L-lactate dehydrogenase complex protein LldG